MEDVAVNLNIYARNVETISGGNTTIYIKNAPANSSFSSGTKVNEDIRLFLEDLVNLTFTPPLHSAKTFILSIMAIVQHADGRAASRSASLPVKVLPVADTPVVSTNDPCITPNSTFVNLQISTALKDQDGSEILSINITNIPSSYNLSQSTKITEDDLFVVDPFKANDLIIYSEKQLNPFNVTIVVAAKEKVNGNISAAYKHLDIKFCKGNKFFQEIKLF